VKVGPFCRDNPDIARGFVEASRYIESSVWGDRVSISKTETRGEGERSVPTQLLPKKFNDYTELTADVTANANKLDFDLKSR
jgi:hypothetical protein